MDNLVYYIPHCTTSFHGVKAYSVTYIAFKYLYPQNLKFDYSKYHPQGKCTPDLRLLIGKLATSLILFAIPRNNHSYMCPTFTKSMNILKMGGKKSQRELVKQFLSPQDKVI